MYASANTKTKINQVVPALVPLGDEIWEKGTKKEDINGSSGSGSLTTPLVHLESWHTTLTVQEIVYPALAKRRLIRGAPCPQGFHCLVRETK